MTDSFDRVYADVRTRVEELRRRHPPDLDPGRPNDLVAGIKHIENEVAELNDAWRDSARHGRYADMRNEVLDVAGCAVRLAEALDRVGPHGS